MGGILRFSAKNEELIQRIRDGDGNALVALFSDNRKAVLSLVVRNSGTADDAEDILQEALVVLWQRIRAGRFEQTAQLGTFVYATARNLWLRRLAGRRREGRTGLPDSETASDDPSVLDILVESERTSRMAEAMKKLSETCRRLLTAFYWDEQSMEEIANQLGFANAQTAKSKKYQCKQALKELLQ